MDFSPRYGKAQSNHKGQPKGKGKYKSHQSGKRGRDPDDPREGRAVRQRTQWDSEGTAIAITWSRSQQLRNYMRALTLENARALLEALKKAHTDFQNNASNIKYENWHERIDENSLILQQAIGMPIRLLISPHFYYKAAQWSCKQNINMLSLNEYSDPNFLALFGEWYPNSFDNYEAIVVPNEILQLGESIAQDWRIAKRSLDEQDNITKAYSDRRANFYKAAIVNNDARPTMTFSEQEHTQPDEENVPHQQKQRCAIPLHQTF